MSKPFMPVLALCLLAATTAHAQYGGGGGGGHGGRGGRSKQPPTPSAPAQITPQATPEKSPASDQIVGEIKAIDPESNRITIAYEAVDALNWPAGTRPFVVAKTELLKGATVGEKVRFKLESQQISALSPY